MKQQFLAICICIISVAFIITAGCTGTEPAPAPGTPLPSEPGVTATVSGNGPPPPAGVYPGTAGEIKEYVDAAAVWAQEHGRDEALAAFGNGSGPFVTGDVYIYALDYAGIALALPFQPGMVGTDFSPLLDAYGKPYTDIEIKLAQGGGGYILYHYPYPTGDQPIRLKISYVRPVDDTYWIGAGLYTSEDRFIDPALRQFIMDARSYAVTAGREEALAAFNDLDGPFIDRDLYVFAYDYNGTVLAWPYHPEMLGVNRYNATDPMGTFHVRSFLTTAEQGGGMVDYYTTNPRTNTSGLKVSWITDVDGTWLIGAGRYIEPGPLVLRS